MTDLATQLLNANWMNPGAAAAPVSAPVAAPAPAFQFTTPSYSQLSSFGAPAANSSPFSYGMGGAVPEGVTTGPAAQQSWFGKAGGWLSDGRNLGTVVQGLGTLASAYLGFRQLSMAKDQLNFSKDSWAKNFANSTKTYNTSLEDRIRGRTSSYDGKEKDVQAYLARHSLKG